jgi:23S rRNA-/tRNA-specific pseudouridylate synthase
VEAVLGEKGEEVAAAAAVEDEELCACLWRAHARWRRVLGHWAPIFSCGRGGDSSAVALRAERKRRKRARKAARRHEQEVRERPLVLGALQYFQPSIRGPASGRFLGVDRPVAAGAVDVLYQSARLIVVAKPAPMPINRGPDYYRANLRHILKQQLAISGRLSAVHRLDICTTGVVLLSTDKRATNAFASKLRERQVTKLYLALVEGSFPWAPQVCSEPVDGKPSKTSFYRLKRTSGNGDDPTRHTHESLLLAIPLTGRKHQIRKHLASLGFPILGDIVYRPTSSNELHYLLPKDPYLTGADGGKLVDMLNTVLDLYAGEKGTKGTVGANKDSVSVETLRAHVGPKAQRPWKQGNTTVWMQPIALHAWIIAGRGSLVHAEDSQEPWCFKAPEPEWAKHDFKSIPDAVVTRVPWQCAP